MDKFHSTRTYYNNFYFTNKEDAQKVIDKFKHCYDNYHVPYAISQRMNFYDGQDNISPYFLDTKKLNKIKKTKTYNNVEEIQFDMEDLISKKRKITILEEEVF